MSKRVYVDTNVFIDFFQDRDSAAYKFIIKSVKCTYEIVISDLVIQEAVRAGFEVEIQNTVELLKAANKISVITLENADKEQAEAIVQEQRTHRADARHIAAAQRISVAGIVTKNLKDFVGIAKIPVYNPDTL